jgi:hypothetical protein
MVEIEVKVELCRKPCLPKDLFAEKTAQLEEAP